MQQLCNLGYQQKDCCCETQRSIDGVKFTIAQEDCATRNLMQYNTRDLMENQNANARAVLDALTAQRLEAKDERIAAQAAQIQPFTAIVTPAAVRDSFNVHAEAIIDVPRGCCLTVALKNTSTQPITAQNVNVIVDRVA